MTLDGRMLRSVAARLGQLSPLLPSIFACVTQHSEAING
jgi:hypothetical protein